MFSESHPVFRRMIRFLMLPYCYYKLNWKECRRNPFVVLFDFLYLFFVLKTYPDNYGSCRLWEISRENWKFYYGSGYHPYQRQRLRKKVQRHEYRILFNDKVVCEQLCKGIGVALPVTVGFIWQSNDSRGVLERIFAKTSQRKLIIKPITGRAGMGIVLAEKTGDGIVIIQRENQTIPFDKYVLKEAAIVQELIVQDSRMAQISDTSVNTIRVLTIMTETNDSVIVSATARFSANSEAYIDNWSAGGVAVGVNCQTGYLMKFAFDKVGNRYTHHPVSGILFEGFQIPEWEKILVTARKVQNAFPFYRLIGMDIAIAKDGIPVLIEVNASTDLIFQEQTSGPLLANKEILKIFSKYGLLVAKSQITMAKSSFKESLKRRGAKSVN